MLHRRAFTVTVLWTLILLYLGSVVHATESSLACPDWPTCFGTLAPEMTGGVFWEHLHRLVAGGLLLMFGLATWLAHKEVADRPWVFKACVGGIVLLLVQSVFGGLTVIFLLPDLLSTTHLALAFSFLALVTVLASATSWSRNAEPMAAEAGRKIRRWAAIAAGLVFAQSVLGGLVRHMDAGMACPDVPFCLGQVVPPLDNALITVHFLHRVLGVIVALVVIGVAVWAVRSALPGAIRSWASLAAVLVLAQLALGLLSVTTTLAVIPVSLHTLVAAGLLTVLVHLSTLGHTALREAESASATAL